MQHDGSTSARPRRGPLSGVRVIDMATVIAGPGAARHLADFGADVIKVERPGGDSARSLGWRLPEDDDSLFWHLLNRGKRSIVLDLKNADDYRTMLQLLADADILVENMRPGKLESIGLAPQRLWQENPSLVVLRVTGFGQTGPYAQRPGFATIAEALSGLSQLTGEPGGAPLLPPVALTDEITALVGAFSVLAALRHAEQTGEGQVVDVNLLESVLQIMGPLPSAWAHLGYLQPRLGAGIPYTVPRGTYRCADGVWVALSTTAESVAARVLRLLGLGGEARFSDAHARFTNRDELEQRTAAWIAARASREVLDAFSNVDAAIAPVYDMSDVAADPHVVEREALVRVGNVTMQNVVARLSRTPGGIDAPGPRLGQHRDEILAELAERTHSTPSGTARPGRNDRETGQGVCTPR